MTPFEPGETVLVRFPFTDLTAVKKRPAVIVSPVEFTRRHSDVVLLALTGQPQADPAIDLQDWRSAGLLKPTWIKPLIATVSSSVVVRRLGRITSADKANVRKAMKILISPLTG